MSPSPAPGPHPLRLDDFVVPPDVPVWVLAPHPDDFDAIAVTLRHFKDRRHPIHLSVVSSGASGVLDEEGGPVDKGGLREVEQRTSCRFFGLPEERLHFLRLQEDPQGDPMDSPRNQEQIHAELSRIRPTLVCLPHGHDTNPGHRRTYAMLKRLLTTWPHPVTALLVRDPKTLGMRTDLYTPFSEEDAQWKARLLRFHQSQQHRNLVTRGHGFDERVLDMNRETAAGLPGGPAYAELFELEQFGPEEPW